MLNITSKAKEVLDEHFEGKDKEQVRIYIASGCGGSRLALGIDTAKEGDEVIELEGYEFVIAEDLLEQAKPLTIDLTPMGITIGSSLVFEEQGSGCSGCGCGCS